MLSREQMNEMWIVDCNGIKILSMPARKDTKLRRPYTHRVDGLNHISVKKGIKSSIPHQLHLNTVYIKTKPTSRGFRLEVFLLGLGGGVDTTFNGITKEMWDRACESCERYLSFILKCQPITYKEEWSATKKFQFRFECYVMTSQ